MKKLFISAVVLIAFLISAALSHAAALGTCLDTYASLSADKMVVTFTCTASVDDASFPSTSTSATSLKGFYITEVRTNPGTAPTTGYDIVLNDSDGIDLMGGTLADRSATASERAVPLLATNWYGKTMIDGVVTLVITNNSVNSATVTVKVFLVK